MKIQILDDENRQRKDRDIQQSIDELIDKHERCKGDTLSIDCERKIVDSSDRAALEDYNPETCKQPQNAKCRDQVCDNSEFPGREDCAVQAESRYFDGGDSKGEERFHYP